MNPVPDATDASAGPFAAPAPEGLPDGALARLGTTRLRQNNSYFLAWAADGRSLVVGSMGVHRWDATTGRELMGPKEALPLWAMALSADGRLLALVPSLRAKAGEAPRTPVVQIWNLATGRRFDLAGPVHEISGLAFSPDGTTLASVAGDHKAASLWDVASGRLRVELPWHVSGPEYGIEIKHGMVLPSVRSGRSMGLGIMAFSPDGRTLATEGFDPAPEPDRPFEDVCSVKLWDVASGRLLSAIESLPLRAVAFSPDGTHLFVSDGSIRAWQVTTVEPLWGPVSKGPGRGEPVPALAVSPDGRTLAAGYDSGEIELFDAADGRLIRSIAAHAMSVTSLAFSPDGARLASGNHGGTIKLWDPATGAEVLAVPDAPTESIRALAVSPDGRLVATSGPDAIIRVWDLATGRHVRALVGSPKCVEVLAFAPDGRSLASGEINGVVRTWDVATGRALHVLSGLAIMENRIESLVFSPDGSVLVASDVHGNVMAWATATGDFRFEAPGRGTPIGCTADGQEVVLFQRWSTFRAIDLATGQERPGPIAGPIAFAPGRATPDGSLISVGAVHYRFRVIDRGGADRFEGLVGAETTSGASAFSPDGRTLAVALESNVLVVDVASSRLVHTFRGHRAPIESLAFSPDGSKLLSGGRDTNVLIWDLASVRPHAR